MYAETVAKTMHRSTENLFHLDNSPTTDKAWCCIVEQRIIQFTLNRGTKISPAPNLKLGRRVHVNSNLVCLSLLKR